MKMEDMRTVLRGSLGRSLQAFGEADRLTAAWPVACGKAMAAHGEVVGFLGGTVTVAVSDAAWLSQMMSMRSLLQNEMARIARVKVTAIHFELKDQRRYTAQEKQMTADAILAATIPSVLPTLMVLVGILLNKNDINHVRTSISELRGEMNGLRGDS